MPCWSSHCDAARSSPRAGASRLRLLGAQDGHAAAAGGTVSGRPRPPAVRCARPPLARPSLARGPPRLLFSESAEASLASALPPGSLASRLGPGKADFAFGIRRGSRLPPWKRLPLGTRARVASPGLTRPAPSSAGTHAVPYLRPRFSASRPQDARGGLQILFTPLSMNE